MTVLIFGTSENGSLPILLRRSCSDFFWPLPSCGENQDATVLVELVPIVASLLTFGPPLSIRFLLFAAEETKNDYLRTLELRLYDNGIEIKSSSVNCFMIGDVDQVWPMEKNNTELWRSHFFSFSLPSLLKRVQAP